VLPTSPSSSAQEILFRRASRRSGETPANTVLCVTHENLETVSSPAIKAIRKDFVQNLVNARLFQIFPSHHEKLLGNSSVSVHFKVGSGSALQRPIVPHMGKLSTPISGTLESEEKTKQMAKKWYDMFNVAHS
jgi:hypothetical protein